ncbi:MAG TPA: GWxTD domain-containing protein, partial [Bryobacteraceae bacterium]|nr:GWxTD domain-containing protein [Bryobacteraceae bacterium]
MKMPLVNAVAAALFHFLWEGAALALMLAMALGICRGAKVRHALACAALAGMAAAFVVTLALLYPHTITFANPIGWPKPAAFIPSGSAIAAAEPLTNRIQEAMRWFVPVWFAGVVLFYLRSAASWIAIVNLRRAGASLVPAECQSRLADLAGRMRIAKTVKLLESARVDVPAVAGFLRPVIFVPVGFLAGMPPDRLEYLLIHELAHIHRCDCLVNLLQKAIEGLLFYHPAVWWVSSVITRERENCCDDIVLSIHPEPARYAATLATLEQTRWAALPAANGGSLTQRIRRILNRPAQSHTASAPALAAAMLAISAAVAFAAIQQLPMRVSFAQAQTQVAADAFERWLNEDVAYIIQDQERLASKNLKTDRERDRFIEQFWERRDPTPGTPENEFKDEHYRRIAYANTRFSSPTLAGWKSDRGRIYITFGPPNEIDSHPSCGTATPARDDWKYRFIEGIGNDVIINFTDIDCKGEYPMTRDPRVAIF